MPALAPHRTTDADFGVVITTSAADRHLACGTCASVRHFMGDVPIALFVDGDVSFELLQRTYGVSVHRVGDLGHRELRRIGFGWGRTKMAALWEAPFRTALFVDADTIVLGDVRCHADFAKADVITDRHFAEAHADYFAQPPLDRFLGTNSTAAETLAAHLAGWFFQPALLAARYPAFDWRAALARIFCPGALFARTGLFELDTYLRLHEDRMDGSGIFASGDMGVLNVMVLSAAQSGAIRHAQSPDLHVLAFRHDARALDRRFPSDPDGTPRAPERPSVLHWSGHPKPALQGHGHFAAPMTQFRRMFLRDAGLCDDAEIDARLAQEDARMAALVPAAAPEQTAALP